MAVIQKIAPVALLLFAFWGCKDAPTEPKPEPESEQAGLISLTLNERIEVSINDTLHYCWEVMGELEADSLIIEYMAPEPASRTWKFLQSVPCTSGCLNIPVRAINKVDFSLRIRTPGMEKVAFSARISVYELKLLWFTTYTEASVLREGDTLHVCWRTTDLDRTEVFVMEYSPLPEGDWQYLRNIVIGEFCVNILATEIPESDFYLRFRNMAGSISTTSAQIHITTDDAPGTVAFLPTSLDTLIYHRDVLRWNILPDHVEEVHGVYVQQQIVGREWERSKWFDVSNKEFHPSDLIDATDAQYLDYNPQRRFRIRPESDTTWTYSPVYTIVDFRLTGPPPGSIIKRGTIVHGAASHPAGPLAEHFWSTDGGITWKAVKQNAFANERYDNSTKLFPLPPGQECYYAMKGWRGSRLFADTLGPYTVLDDTRPIVSFELGEKWTYEFMDDDQGEISRDTVTGTLERIEQIEDRIEYTFRTGAGTEPWNFQTVIEYPAEMHRLSGWVFDDFTSHLTVYRFADQDLDEYSVYWDDGPSRARMTMRLGIGLTEYSFQSRMGGTWYARSTIHIP